MWWVVFPRIERKLIKKQSNSDSFVGICEPGWFGCHRRNDPCCPTPSSDLCSCKLYHLTVAFIAERGEMLSIPRPMATWLVCGSGEEKESCEIWPQRTQGKVQPVSGGWNVGQGLGSLAQIREIRASLEPETLNITWQLSPHLLSFFIFLRMRAPGI